MRSLRSQLGTQDKGLKLIFQKAGALEALSEKTRSPPVKEAIGEPLTVINVIKSSREAVVRAFNETQNDVAALEANPRGQPAAPRAALKPCADVETHTTATVETVESPPLMDTPQGNVVLGAVKDVKAHLDRMDSVLAKQQSQIAQLQMDQRNVPCAAQPGPSKSVASNRSQKGTNTGKKAKTENSREAHLPPGSLWGLSKEMMTMSATR